MKKVVIVGCGGLGSSIAKTLLNKYNLEELVLIDNDILESSNIICDKDLFPEFYSHQPKNLLIEHFLAQNSKLNVETCLTIYNNMDIDLFNDYIKIDCMDNKKMDSRFSFKLSVDGHFGLIVVNPCDSDKEMQTNYILGQDILYTERLATIFTNFIFKKENKRKRYIVNLLTGGIIDEYDDE